MTSEPTWDAITILLLQSIRNLLVSILNWFWPDQWLTCFYTPIIQFSKLSWQINIVDIESSLAGVYLQEVKGDNDKTLFLFYVWSVEQHWLDGGNLSQAYCALPFFIMWIHKKWIAIAVWTNCEDLFRCNISLADKRNHEQWKRAGLCSWTMNGMSKPVFPSAVEHRDCFHLGSAVHMIWLPRHRFILQHIEKEKESRNCGSKARLSAAQRWMEQ